MSTQAASADQISDLPWGEDETGFRVQITELIGTIAAARGVTMEQMARQYEAFHSQYLATAPDQRPQPPKGWLLQRRFSRTTAIFRDRAATWAAYRCLADPEGIDGTREYASIDIEVSGPSFPALANPVNGCIIEIGVACYDQDGNETASLDTLVAPSPQIAAEHGTGPVHIHGITMDDVADAPAWEEVAPQVAELLDGRILMAHNARFEDTYLFHHMAEAGAAYDPDVFADSLLIAQHAFAWPNHKLATVCQQTGVEYTNGHRAYHDAEVAARAFFAMRDRLKRQYREAGYPGGGVR